MAYLTINNIKISGVAACVPKRVETKVTQTDPAGDPFEVHVEGLVLDEAAEFIGEDQVVCVVPG